MGFALYSCSLLPSCCLRNIVEPLWGLIQCIVLSALLSTNVLCHLSCAAPTNAWKPHLLSVAELAFIGALCSPASSLQYLDYGLQWLNTKLRSSSPPVQGLPHVRSMGWLQYFPCCTVITLASGGACAPHGCCWEGRPVFKDLDAAAAEESQTSTTWLHPLLYPIRQAQSTGFTLWLRSPTKST